MFDFFGSENTGLIDVVFDGPALGDTSVPISDLAKVLASVQRIVNKAYLYRQDRLVRGARLSYQESNNLALKIAYRRSGSDLYGLTAFFSDPIVVNTVSNLLVITLIASSHEAFYYLMKVI